MGRSGSRCTRWAAAVTPLAVPLGGPGAETAAVGLLLIGTLVSIGVLSRQVSGLSFALSIVAVAGGYLLLALGTRGAPPHLVKWILIGIALLAALPLVVSIRGGERAADRRKPRVAAGRPLGQDRGGRGLRLPRLVSAPGCGRPTSPS